MNYNLYIGTTIHSSTAHRVFINKSAHHAFTLFRGIETKSEQEGDWYGN